MTCSSSKELQLCLKHEIQLWPGESSPPQPHSCCLLAAHIHCATRRSLRKVSSLHPLWRQESRILDSSAWLMAICVPCCAAQSQILPEQHTDLPPAAEWSQTPPFSSCPVGNVGWFCCCTWEEDAGAKPHCRSCSPAGGKIKGLGNGSLSPSYMKAGDPLLLRAVRRVPLVLLLLLLLCPVRLAQGGGDAAGWNHNSWITGLGKVPAHGRRWNQVALKVLSNPNHVRVVWFPQCLVGNSSPPKLTNLSMTKCCSGEADGNLQGNRAGCGIGGLCRVKELFWWLFPPESSEVHRGETWAVSCKESCAAALPWVWQLREEGGRDVFPHPRTAFPSLPAWVGRTPWNDLINHQWSFPVWTCCELLPHIQIPLYCFSCSFSFPLCSSGSNCILACFQ